jgi:hypothetical protein
MRAVLLAVLSVLQWVTWSKACLSTSELLLLYFNCTLHVGGSSLQVMYAAAAAGSGRSCQGCAQHPARLVSKQIACVGAPAAGFHIIAGLCCCASTTKLQRATWVLHFTQIASYSCAAM